jgi:hypothetical protein
MRRLLLRLKPVTLTWRHLEESPFLVQTMGMKGKEVSGKRSWEEVLELRQRSSSFVPKKNTFTQRLSYRLKLGSKRRIRPMARELACFGILSLHPCILV